MIIRIGVHERELDVTGNPLAVELAHKGRAIGVQRGVLPGCQVGGISQLQAIETVEAQPAQDRLYEAQPVYQAHGHPFLAGKPQDALYGGLADEGVTRHRVYDPSWSQSERHDLRGNLVIYGGKVPGRLVQVVKAVEDQVRGQ